MSANAQESFTFRTCPSGVFLSFYDFCSFSFTPISAVATLCLIFRMDLAALATISPEEQPAYMEALLEGPALEPPPGVITDFANPGGHHGVGYGIVILGATLATTAVAVRLYSRVAIKRINIEDGTFDQSLCRRVLTFARPIDLGIGMQV